MIEKERVRLNPRSGGNYVEHRLWVIQSAGWLLFAYLVVAQCAAAVSYALGMKMGTPEPTERITDVGVSFFKGYAGAALGLVLLIVTT